MELDLDKRAEGISLWHWKLLELLSFFLIVIYFLLFSCLCLFVVINLYSEWAARKVAGILQSAKADSNKILNPIEALAGLLFGKWPNNKPIVTREKWQQRLFKSTEYQNVTSILNINVPGHCLWAWELHAARSPWRHRGRECCRAGFWAVQSNEVPPEMWLF